MNPYHDTLIAAGWRQDLTDPSVYRRYRLLLRTTENGWRAVVQFRNPPKGFVGKGSSPTEALIGLAEGLEIPTRSFAQQQRLDTASLARGVSTLRPLPPEHMELLNRGWFEVSGDTVVYQRGAVSLNLQEGRWGATATAVGFTVEPHATYTEALEVLSQSALEEARRQIHHDWQQAAVLLGVVRDTGAMP